MCYVQLFGLRLFAGDAATPVQLVVQAAAERRPFSVAFVNASSVECLYAGGDFRQFLEATNLLLIDGIGIRIACGIAGYPKAPNLNGTDFLPQLLESCAEHRLLVGLLGASETSSKACAERISQRWPELRLGFRHNGFWKDDAEIRKALTSAGVDVLLVALGSPKQEAFAANLASHPSVVLSVGGFFDFFGGTKPRAPSCLRKLGLEWCFRLMLEPRRLFNRYVIGVPRYLIRCASLKIQGRLATG
jgi:N-acetylglucosaminyldiphosphoundecaprenol N-acetyl-beta-D-mannosaminyltransferase